MAAGPKGVAERPASLPAQQAAADPLRSYCPDLDQWPASWAYEPRDIPPGLRMVECFQPFLRELLALSLSRKTLRRHRDNIWVLGGEVIRRLQIAGVVVLAIAGNRGGAIHAAADCPTEHAVDAEQPVGPWLRHRVFA